MVRFSLVPYSADRGQVHKLPKNRPIDSIDLNRLRKNKVYKMETACIPAHMPVKYLWALKTRYLQM